MAVTLPRLLRRLRPDVAHFIHALPLRCPCPAVVTVQDLSWERDPSVFGFWDLATFKVFVRRAVRKAERVLAISERTKRDLIELYGTPSEKIAVTPLAPDPAFVPAGEHDSFLLFVSAIEPRKQPLAAIDAANAVGRKLVVVGPPKDEELAAELRRRGADVRGYVPKDELVRLYQQAACLVFPSRYEGFGLPVVEAMACGTPVVMAFDSEIHRWCFPELPPVVDARTPEQIYAALRRLAEDQPELERLGRQGREWIERHHGWRLVVDRHLEIYEEVLDARP